LNKAGDKNVMQQFKVLTGLKYSRNQFKNKWDTLKSDYNIWKLLLNESGLGFDASGNVDMTDEWWKRTAKVSAL